MGSSSDSERSPLMGDALAARLSRRRLLRTTAVGAGALALSGTLKPRLGAAADSEASKVTGEFNWKRDTGKTIKALLNQHPYQEALVGELQKFSDLTGIKVEYDIFPENNYFDKLTVALQSKQGTYDVFMLGAYFVWQYGPQGFLEDMAPWIQNRSATNPDYAWEDIFPNLRAADQWSLKVPDPLGTGGQYALPWGFETNTVMYNTEVFDKLKVKPAETFAELIELATKLNKDAPGAGYSGMYGIGVRGSRQWATIHPGFMTAYSRMGGKDFQLSGNKLTPAMNSDVAVDFTGKWAKMVKDAGPPNWTNYFWYDVGNDFGAGKSAMIFDADILGFFNNAAATATQKAGSSIAGKIGWHPGPKGPNGELLTNQWIWSLGMDANSQHKSAAWLFLQWATGKDHLRTAAITYNMVDPVRKSIADDPEFQNKMKRNIGYTDTFNKIIDQTKILFTPQPNFFEFTTLWAAALQEIYAGSDAKQTLDKLVKAIEDQQLQ